MHARLLAAYRLLQIRKIDKLIRLTPQLVRDHQRLRDQARYHRDTLPFSCIAATK